MSPFYYKPCSFDGLVLPTFSVLFKICSSTLLVHPIKLRVNKDKLAKYCLIPCMLIICRYSLSKYQVKLSFKNVVQKNHHTNSKILLKLTTLVTVNAFLELPWTC